MLRQSLGQCEAILRPVEGNLKAMLRQSLGQCEAVLRPVEGNLKAMLRQGLGPILKERCHEILVKGARQGQAIP